jgi:hypothetical protein
VVLKFQDSSSISFATASCSCRIADSLERERERAREKARERQSFDGWFGSSRIHLQSHLQQLPAASELRLFRRYLLLYFAF